MYEVSTGVRITRNEDGGVVLDILNGQIFRLNPVGILILGSLSNGCDVPEIAGDIVHRYNISEEIALSDIRDFLQSLQGHGIIRSGKTLI